MFLYVCSHLYVIACVCYHVYVIKCYMSSSSVTCHHQVLHVIIKCYMSSSSVTCHQVLHVIKCYMSSSVKCHRTSMLPRVNGISCMCSHVFITTCTLPHVYFASVCHHVYVIARVGYVITSRLCHHV